MNIHNNDTICAIITPPGNSTLGGVRISGDDAHRIAASIFATQNPGMLKSVRGIYHGRCRLLFSDKCSNSAATEIETTAFIYIFTAPHSYTCEDIAEIFVPGSIPILNALLRIIIHNGSRLAEPGEFTLRAFLNGRLSLGEAESVERIIRAQTENQRQLAVNRLEGNFEQKLKQWKSELLLLAGTLETTIDFEDEDIEDDLEHDLIDRLNRLAAEATELARQSSTSQHLYSAETRVVLAGLTNSGKSSILNALLEEKRALISPERSTTRDHTEHHLTINELSFIIEDCPGIDIKSSIIADGATARAKNRFQAGNILLLVIDSNAVNYAELTNLIDNLPHCRSLILFNKSDLPQNLDKATIIDSLEEKTEVIGIHGVSALNGDGIRELRDTLYKEGLSDNDNYSGVGLSAREEEELHHASNHALAAVEALSFGVEMAAIELREAYEALARLGGEGYAEDILENVFSRFCIGK